MTVGQRIRQLRRERNLTQENLGANIGIPGHTIYAWEKDKFKPNLHHMCLLLEAFNMSLKEFMKGVEIE